MSCQVILLGGQKIWLSVSDIRAVHRAPPTWIKLVMQQLDLFKLSVGDGKQLQKAHTIILATKFKYKIKVIRLFANLNTVVYVSDQPKR